jgi:hypothetical protein
MLPLLLLLLLLLMWMLLSCQAQACGAAQANQQNTVRRWLCQLCNMHEGLHANILQHLLAVSLC